MQNPDIDVFVSLASKWKNKKLEEVNNHDRTETKHICYAILYGMGPKNLSIRLNKSKDEAQKMIDKFKDTYPGMKKYLAHVLLECRKKGYVETVLGRRRHLANIFSPDTKTRSQAERQAINTICQGSAADITKKAMINIAHYLSTNKKKNKALVATS
eukprot:TRINITY_DN10301_c0_g1_i7.p2 TRINITY_DN10301_c0_g1~~TRINITY_DN10301_c0_g1_i7.p2  ORF type:complete len:157 (-),score=36.75 TRINITY_DN10301_c0_g1_i7:251-721(-)